LGHGNYKLQVKKFGFMWVYVQEDGKDKIFNDFTDLVKYIQKLKY
jgi:hypothetical protein